MPKKPYSPPTLAPLASTDPRALATKVDALEATIATLRGQYEAAKGFLLEAERRSADLRKAVRAAVQELRKGDGAAIGEIASSLEAAILPPSTPATAHGGPMPGSSPAACVTCGAVLQANGVCPYDASKRAEAAQ